ncbi:major facilitator superfamily domain-containing protein [Lactifluus volemus]|nr:major facilitator superfamily domain-containing protein [Lactifluus volemus]
MSCEDQACAAGKDPPNVDFLRAFVFSSGGRGKESFAPPAETTEAPGIVEDWTVDPRNPRNWPQRKKWAAVSVVSMYTVVAAIVSSMMAPALPYIAERFHIVNPTELALTLSIFMLSFALSPLLNAPLSEMYGRTWIIHINNLLFVAFNLACAFAPSKAALIVFRFFSGWAGGAPIAVGGGIVGDVFAAEDRAVAMAVYTLGPVVAPAIGPAIGGFMAETIGWKYLFILVAGISALASVAGILLYRETYAPYLGIYYLMFATFPDLFNNVYHFGTGVAGLAYLGLGVGFTVATLAARNGGEGKPEMRVPAILVGSCIVPIGLFWYGWTAQARAHWIMPIIGTGIFGFGAMITFLPIHLYLVDTFTYAASALSAASVTRSMLAFAFPLFGSQMFDALGLGLGNSLLALLTIALGIPFPILIWFYGEQLRARSVWTR